MTSVLISVHVDLRVLIALLTEVLIWSIIFTRYCSAVQINHNHHNIPTQSFSSYKRPHLGHCASLSSLNSMLSCLEIESTSNLFSNISAVSLLMPLLSSFYSHPLLTLSLCQFFSSSESIVPFPFSVLPALSPIFMHSSMLLSQLLLFYSFEFPTSVSVMTLALLLRAGFLFHFEGFGLGSAERVSRE